MPAQQYHYERVWSLGGLMDSNFLQLFQGGGGGSILYDTKDVQARTMHERYLYDIT